MLTAIEAVNCYCNITKSKESIWNVNTEEEYHEIISKNITEYHKTGSNLRTMRGKSTSISKQK